MMKEDKQRTQSDLIQADTKRAEENTKTRQHTTQIEESETGRKLAEAEELYKVMAESSLGAVFIVQDGKMQFINTSAIAYAGYTAEEVIGQDAYILVHPDDREKVKTLSGEILAGRRKSAFDFRLITKNKHIRWISQTVTPIQYRGKPAILGNAIDVTELKQAEELYKVMAESSPGSRFHCPGRKDAVYQHQRHRLCRLYRGRGHRTGLMHTCPPRRQGKG